MELLIQTRDYFFPYLSAESAASSSSSSSSSSSVSRDFLAAPEELSAELRDLSRKLSLLCDQALDPAAAAAAASGEGKRGPGSAGGALGIKQISFLLKTHLKRAADPMQRIKYFTDVLYEFLRTAGDKAASNRRQYKVLTSKTLAAFYSPVLQTLTACFSAIVTQLGDEESAAAMAGTTIMFGGGQGRGAAADSPDLGEQLHSIVKLFNKLVNITKLQNEGLVSHSVLCSALKDGRLFLDSFLRHSKVLHSLFSTQRSSVMALLNTLQKATRQLHSICSYGKQKRDKSLAHEAPYLKRALESLIYKMKEMASDNKCLGAVWVGTLKNRHLDGTEMAAEEEEEEDIYEDEYETESEGEGEGDDDVDRDVDRDRDGDIDGGRGANTLSDDGLGLLSDVDSGDSDNGAELGASRGRIDERGGRAAGAGQRQRGGKKRVPDDTAAITTETLMVSTEEHTAKRVKRRIVASDDDGSGSDNN
jgi:hypothetical protein